MQSGSVIKSYLVAVILGNIFKIHYICPIYLAEMIFRQFIVYMRHGFAAMYFFVSQSDDAVLIIRLKIKNIVCVKTNRIVSVLYPKRTVVGACFKKVVEQFEENLFVNGFHQKTVRIHLEGFKDKSRICA